MLLRFAVENFRSVRKYTQLSFLATSQKDEPAFRLPCPAARYGVLPVVGVFGGNASGKSNLLHALTTLGDLVNHSAARAGPQEPIPWTPFRMETKTGAQPTQFDADFVADGVLHHYGFSYTASAVHEEWLYRWPGRSRQRVFHRSDSDGRNPWSFGPTLGGARRLIAEATRPNALFLSTAALLNHDSLGQVARTLGSLTRTARRLQGDDFRLAPNDAVVQPGNRGAVEAFLQAADLGIHGFELREDPDLADIRRRLAEDPPTAHLASKLARSLQVEFHHRDERGGTWILPSMAESEGTRAVVLRLNEVLPVLADAGLLVVDEIDTSLHPDLCAALVGLFTSERTNPHGAQLLFSSHDRGLLQRLRRDEIVFTDKGADGATSVRSASDFRGVRGREDLRRLHEQGRLGGVPVLGDFRVALRQDFTDG